MPWILNLRQLAEEIRYAPSIFNSQPWFFKVTDDDRIEMYIRDGINLYDGQGSGDGADPQRLRLPGNDKDVSRLDPLARGLDPPARRLDPLAREFVISCGAALYNLRLAIRVAGHDMAVRLPPHPARDPRLLASVEIMIGRVRAPTITEQELYEAIWRRHTNRWPHTIIPAPLPIIVAMENAALQEGASLRLLHPDQANRWLRLADQADSFFRDKENLLRDTKNAGDLSGAVRRYDLHQEYRSRWVTRPDGVPKTAFGPAGGPTREDFWLDKPQPFEKPQLMALSTDDDQILDWLRAGQALQHAILTGTRFSVSPPHGLAAKYHASYRYGLPGRHHLVRRWRRDLAFDGLSVSLLTQPLEQYDIVRFTGPANENPEDAKLRDARLRPRPRPWRFAELPQVVIRVGYAVRPTGDAPRQWNRKQIIVDDRPEPNP